MFARFAILLMILVILGANSQPQTLQACVPDNACGSNGQVSGINVDYYCICEPNFVGQYCEHLENFVAYDFKGERTRVQKPANQFCISVQTQCINGDPQLTDPQAVCA